ncbi:NAD-dependent epimerase/dehydratase family protein [Cnuibacter physcomitrellae]|uniref:NAD-dependent epimerase/dehydratase family protein n=1 Tax=Cnuibacter physcomitrellae TaxID=1619308 RepID=UPI002175B18F|nr:NAD-dependent epimerase/dehydratase family protein [Cnuibacter physcomitrellae]MCS5498858.1 NAD-dependent epimerase/dehydratase family protein [Cnuibacter physcomitrellae]
MRIFVAGASGVLGRALIPLALAEGHEVIGMTRSDRGADAVRALGATPVIADAFDADLVASAVASSSPDAIIDLLTDLATGDSGDNAHLRIHGTRHLVDAAREAGVETMVAESISWIHPSGSDPADEGTPLDLDAAEPRRTTVRAVAALERTVAEIAHAVVLRLGQLYGEGTWYARDGRYADAARAGSLPATETVVSFVHVDDAARAALDALRWPAGVWHIVDDEPAAGTAWVPVFAEAVGAPRPERSESGDIGRPVSNGRARANGLMLRYPSWREGFLA